MSAFDELEEDLTPEAPSEVTPAEDASRLVDETFFGEAPRHQPRLQWSWTPFQNAVNDVLGMMLAPFRFLLRLMPRG